MSRLIVVLIWAVSLTVALAPASAQAADGPYAPFPTGAPPSQAAQYFERLGVDVGLRQLSNGAFLRGLSAPGDAGDASRRAGVPATGPGIAVLLLALALAGAGTGLLTARRGAIASQT